MPTFSSYPALQARAPDVWGAMQRGAESVQMNQLRQMKMGQMQADWQKQGREEQRAKALEQMGQVADLLTPFADPSMPGIQKAQMWPQMLQRAQQMGLPVDKAPQQYDPQWVAMTMAQAGKYQVMAGAEKRPAGYRQAEGGLEFIPGGPADPAQVARLDEAKPGDKAPKGLSVGEAYNSLLEYQAYEDAGETPPRKVANRARAATHVLQTKRYRTTPAGDVVSYTPGVPPGFSILGQERGPAVVSGAEAQVAGGLKTEIEAAPKVDVNKPLSTMQKIAGILNDPSGETVTGIAGTAKRLAGGLARQAGIPVSEQSARLQRLLETLQGQMGPIILNEKRLSETERARLERIVGSVSPTMDEQALRSALADLYDFIAGLEGS